jgi:DNA helicase IV
VATQHPDLAVEQAYIDNAQELLAASRESAVAVQDMVEVGQGGTHQARYEREVIHDSINARLNELDLGGSSLIFGRIDLEPSEHDNDTFYIGRAALWNKQQDPVVVDWRAPIAEPFFRATGAEPLGIEMRRQFSTRGTTLLALEDEFFGELGKQRGVQALASRIRGEQTLLASLDASRTGRLGDIVATIQAEQDEIIRSEQRGILIVQGGPGTGKTVVALHRAAYLLYNHRFPLEGQGVLVVGPNRVFLTYIEQVLPSLGEVGIEMAVLGDLIPEHEIMGRDAESVGRIKGDKRMVKALYKAMLDRERPLRREFVVGVGLQRVRLTVEASADIIKQTRRRSRNHNSGRKIIEELVYAELAGSARNRFEPDAMREALHGTLEMREVFEWMWPVLTPVQMLHDLFGSKALLRSAGKRFFTYEEIERMQSERSSHSSEVVWTVDDVPLLDEVRWLLGSRSGRAKQEMVRTYGHIVVDEAQDLSPMQLRMLGRRSLNGSMTLVGDIAQATGAWAHNDWEEIIEHLPNKRPARRAELTVGYRLPGPTMDVAARVLAVAAPDLVPPQAVRAEGVKPQFVATPIEDRIATVVRQVRAELPHIGSGNLAIVTPASLTEQVSEGLTDAGIDHGQAYRGALTQQVTVVPIGLIKGLELDSSIVVEPNRILNEQTQGPRALYVALTRATQRLSVVHAEALPEYLQGL